MPAWLAVLGPQFGSPVNPNASRLEGARQVLLAAARCGKSIRWFFPAFAERLVNWLMVIAGLAPTVCALALLLLHWDVLLAAK